MVIRVLLGHRGRLVRGALAAALSREQDLQVVGEVGPTEDAASVVIQQRPHVVVLDSSPSIMTSFDQICRTVSARGVLVLVNHDSMAGVLGLAARTPRIGLIASDTTLSNLVDAVRQLARGLPVLDPDVAVAVLRASKNPLTAREQEVLGLVATGVTVQEIARSLSLGVGTVRNHLSHILAKTRARTRIEAIRIAQDAGWI
jgi:two-component system, NarL family, response regulator DesR